MSLFNYLITSPWHYVATIQTPHHTTAPRHPPLGGPQVAAAHINADSVIHFGHTCLSPARWVGKGGLGD